MRLRDRVVALAVLWFAILLACSEAGEPEGEAAERAEPNTKWAEAFARFPRIAVRRNIQGEPAVQTITLNEHAVEIEGKRYDGFRFIVDRSALVEEAQGQGSSSVRLQDFDLVWFFLAPAEVRSWYIVPKQGAMEGFRTFVAPDRLAFKFLEGIEPEDATSIVLQRLEGEHLVDAEEYLIWFELSQDAKTRISFALGYGYNTAEDNSDLAEHLGLSEKSLDERIRDYTRAIEANGDDLQAYYQRGAAWFEKGDLDRAIADYTKVITLDPNNWGAYCERSNLWREKKEYAKELADLKEMVRINPDESQSHWRLARVYALCPDKGLRDSSKALQNAQHACELTKYRDWECLYMLAACYSQVGRFDDAVRRQTEALELAPEGEKEFCRKLLALYRARRPLE